MHIFAKDKLLLNLQKRLIKKNVANVINTRPNLFDVLLTLKRKDFSLFSLC